MITIMQQQAQQQQQNTQTTTIRPNDCHICSTNSAITEQQYVLWNAALCPDIKDHMFRVTTLIFQGHVTSPVL